MQPAWAPVTREQTSAAFSQEFLPFLLAFHGLSVMHQIATIMYLHFKKNKGHGSKVLASGDRRVVTMTTEQLPNRWLRQGGNTGRGSDPAGLGWTAPDFIMVLGMASDFKIMNYFWIFPFNILGPRLTKSKKNPANKITLHSDSF